MTSLLSLTKETPLPILLGKGNAIQSRRIFADRCSPLSRFTTLQTKHPWQIATGITSFIGSSVGSHGMPPAGLTGGMYFLCHVYDNGSQMLRSIAL